MVLFKTNSLKGAGSHIDEKYGIDVEDILGPAFKEKYHLSILPASELREDVVEA